MEQLPTPIARALDPLNRGGGVRPPTPPATKATNTAKGTVYFIQTGRDIKIGWTTCPEQRLKELRTGSPRYLSFLLLLDGKTKQDELALHRRFKECRGRGEWFHLRGELEKYVCEAKGWPYPLPKSTPRCPRYYERKLEQDAALAWLKELVADRAGSE